MTNLILVAVSSIFLFRFAFKLHLFGFRNARKCLIDESYEESDMHCFSCKEIYKIINNRSFMFRFLVACVLKSAAGTIVAMLISLVGCAGDHNAVVFDLHKEYFGGCYVSAGVSYSLHWLFFMCLFCFTEILPAFLEIHCIVVCFVAEFSMSRSGKT